MKNRIVKMALALSLVGTMLASGISVFAFDYHVQEGVGYNAGSDSTTQWDLYVNYGGASASGSFINGSTGMVFCDVIVGGNYYYYENENSSAISMWGGEGQEAYVDFAAY